MSETLGAAVLELRTDNKAYKTGLKRALGDAKRHVKNVAKVTAVAAAAIAGISIKMAADMEKGIREIGTLMGGLTNNEMRAMGQELEVIASRTGQAMDLLTKARYDIVSAGFSSAAESAELLRVSADLATAGVTDIVKAGDLLTTTMNAYGLAAKDAEMISDKLFTTVRLGKTTVEEMAGSLGRVLGVAGTLGIDLDELLAAFATLTTTMGSSERATTATMGAMSALLTPTKDLKRIIKALGHESALAMIKERGFADSIRSVAEKAKEMGITITDAISSMEGLQGILPLTGTAAGTFAENIEGVRDSLGEMSGAAEQMQKDFTLQMNRLKQNVANIMRALGRSLIEIIKPRIEEANEILQQLGEIGWDVVAATVIDNWRLVLNATVEITKIIAPAIGRALVTGMKTGLVGLADIFHDVLASMLNILPWSDVKLKSEETGQSFQDMGDSISEIITNLIAEIQRLAEEGKPPLEVIDKALEGIETAANEVAQSTRNSTESIKLSLGEQAVTWVEAHKTALDTISQFTRAAGNLYSGLANLRKAEIQNELDAALQAALASKQIAIDEANSMVGTEEEKAKAIREIEQGTAAGIATLREEFRQKEIDALKDLKPIKIAQAISNTALGVTQALASTIPPFNFALAALVAAAGAAEIAAINAQPFAHGGIINAPGLIAAGGAVAQVAEAGRPEGVLPLTRMPGGDLGVQAAGGAGGNITLSVTVQSSVIANRQTVRELLEPPLVDLAQKLQSKLVRRV